MTDIEKLLNEKYKNNGAYKVPDGYFNTLNIRINERIQHQKSKRNRLFTIRKYAMAACLLSAIAATGIIAFNKLNQEQIANKTALSETSSESMSEDYVNDCITYAMIDNNDIDMYISEH